MKHGLPRWVRHRAHDGPSEMEKAGFADENGNLFTGAVSSDCVLVPNFVTLEGDFLVWNWNPRELGNDFNSRTAEYDAYLPSGCGPLNEFIGLWKGTPRDETLWPERGRNGSQDQLARAAYKKTLEALLPAARERTLAFARKYGVLFLDKEFVPVHPGDARGEEPLQAWWQFSRKGYAFLKIAAALHEGRLGDRMDWLASIQMSSLISTK